MGKKIISIDGEIKFGNNDQAQYEENVKCMLSQELAYFFRKKCK